MCHFDAAPNRNIWASVTAPPIDLICWLLGEPESVMAEMSTSSAKSSSFMDIPHLIAAASY